MKDRIKIDSKELGRGCAPYIIAELSANHGGDIELAKKSIFAAANAGASAVKLQHYKPETITFNSNAPEYMITSGPWAGQSLYELYNGAFMPWEWTAELVKTAKEAGITLFSSPFDKSAIELLEKFDMPAYKIASTEIIDTALIKLAASTKKPLIISTGNASLAQLDEAIQTALKAGCEELVVLKCTSHYPSLPEEMNLSAIKMLSKIYGCVVGLSDHTRGIAVPVAAVALGASVIEKHFMLDCSVKSADDFFSVTADELKELVSGCNDAFKAIGKPVLESVNLKAGRSLIAVKDIVKGEKLIFNKNFTSLRPGGGIEPKYYDLVDKKTAKTDIKAGALLVWDMIL
ncbi:pseudaminic acid synthase [Campylobacter sp. 19-13652]|uniref:pseudaminic acid synthase n=1 Tax=Campylobacter sp. 19-13652 TaxID=2840180 RepID=UPI001C7824FB|nr:pseudaminic acid synthase [Campylobacter sp. 19-13652]BCX79210.1 pseudaminic acid synthase [Campylobacter sp. 19-13652]